MAMSRSLGWTLLTTRSPIEIVPEVMFSRPASMRSRVDLPQPEGPTRTTNSPSSIGIDTPCRTSKLPNDLRTSRIWTDDIQHPPLNDPANIRERRDRIVSCYGFADAKPSQTHIVRSLHGFGNRLLSRGLVALSIVLCRGNLL